MTTICGIAIFLTWLYTSVSGTWHIIQHKPEAHYLILVLAQLPVWSTSCVGMFTGWMVLRRRKSARVWTVLLSIWVTATFFFGLLILYNMREDSLFPYLYLAYLLLLHWSAVFVVYKQMSNST